MAKVRWGRKCRWESGQELDLFWSQTLQIHSGLEVGGEEVGRKDKLVAGWRGFSWEMQDPREQQCSVGRWS